MAFLYLKIKQTLNIEFLVVFTRTVKIQDHLNENRSSY